MKKYIIAAGLLFVITAGAMAQKPERKTPEERATAQSKQLSKKLSLSNEQEKKIYDISYARAKKMDELQNSHPDRQQMMQQRREIMRSSDKEIGTVLNNDQKKDYDAWKAEARERMGNMRRNGSGQMPKDSSKS